MPSSRIVCPECNVTLKPSQPVPDGRRVKCPKCSAVFAAPGAVAVGGARAAAAPAAAAGKKAPARPAAPAAQAAKAPAEDDDGGTYQVIKMPEDEEDGKQQIKYEPDTSIKDPRGPAQAAVMGPSNQMLLIAALGGLLNVVAFAVWLWPFVFAPHLIDHADFLEQYYMQRLRKGVDQTEQGIIVNRLKIYGTASPPSRESLAEDERKLVDAAENEELHRRLLFLGLCVLGLIYDALITIGAIKMQHLESRGWGLTAAILTIVPVISVGGYMMVGFLLIRTVGRMLDMSDVTDMMMYAWLGATALWALGVGIWGLTVMLRQEVVDGFEYKPD